jgi:hypothetical protein
MVEALQAVLLVELKQQQSNNNKEIDGADRQEVDGKPARVGWVWFSLSLWVA